MNYSKRDVIIGFIIIILIIAGAFYYKNLKTPKTLVTSKPASVEFQKDFEDKFNFDIPDNADSIEVKDVSGGNGRGIATENEVLIDIDNPQVGYFYEGWLEKSDGSMISIGKLKMAKGGWLLEYDKNIQPEASKIVISLEKVNDKIIEKRILEGSF